MENIYYLTMALFIAGLLLVTLFRPNFLLSTVDTLLAWLASTLKQSIDAYCDLETADSEFSLVSHEGSMISIIEIHGVTGLVGNDEFQRLHENLTNALRTGMSQPGHAFQCLFYYDKQGVKRLIENIYAGAMTTAERFRLDLDDLFQERINYMAEFCAEEKVYLALWTHPIHLSGEQLKEAHAQKLKYIRENKISPFIYTQNIVAPIPEIREAHDSFVKGCVNDLGHMGIYCSLLEVHDALRAVRKCYDADVTNEDWQPLLPGDKMKGILEQKNLKYEELSEILWPPLSRQLFSRDAEEIDIRTARIGDKIYATIFIDLFPKDIRFFYALFRRTLSTSIPWRISFSVESNGLNATKFKKLFTTILSFSSAQNRLIADSISALEHIDMNTDDPVMRLRVAASTWAPEKEMSLLRTRMAELTKAIQGWGGCTVAELSGDPFGGAISSSLAISADSLGTATLLPLSSAVYLLPITRPASPWETGAMLFRSPDGKPWAYHPGSRQQTTWIDLFYARPGSGKSVLSNAINLALCLSSGIQRLPRIAIIDIGPSSSGLISLLREALPQEQRHLAAYHRLRMTPDYAINPFDTQLGCRFPTPQERAFLVNFLTLLATPLGSPRAYDGVADLSGMVVDELYKQFADDAKPTQYTPGLELLVDGILEEIGFVRDTRTSWWEVTDALFAAGFTHEALLAQRYAMPLLADAASICRIPAIEDLYGRIIAPTGETLINAFGRMISAAVREYPILSRVTSFDLGEAHIVSLDLDEVAKSGGDAADRQTAVMYMLARYVLARHYYLTEDNVRDMREQYQDYHHRRISELREDPKRLVYDEFHRTSKAQAVRDQVLLDMREGRKWKVQIALISQSVEDFDQTMIEFATSIFILDAGPAQAIEKTARIFGLSPTAEIALRTRVHGPREGGATFLAQFATKYGMNTQLLTCTLGAVELWAFSTTTEDANLRNKLYKRIGPKEARRVLATIFPSGSATKLVEQRLNKMRTDEGFIADVSKISIIDQIADDILREYAKNPNFKGLPF